MDYKGSDKSFTSRDKAAAADTEDNFDPVKEREDAYQKYVDQLKEEEKDGLSLWANKEQYNIHLNLDVESIDDEMAKQDTLNFLYVYDSATSVERDKQDWRVLDLMFYNSIVELEGGYVNAFVYDCQWKGAKVMDFGAFKKNFGCEK